MSDPHRYNPNPHYRLYQKNGEEPTVICVQDFDYPDYTNGVFISSDAWETEEEAQRSLQFFLNIDKLTEEQYIIWEKLDRWLSEIVKIYPELREVNPNIFTEIATHLALKFR